MGKSSWKRRVKAATENQPQESDSPSRQALLDALNERRERLSNHHGDHHHPHNGPCPHNHHGPQVAVKGSNGEEITSNEPVFMCQAPGLGNAEEQDHRAGVIRPPIANGMMAASTESGLADQIHEILTSVKALVFPSPIDTALLRRNVPFVESEDTLVILRSNVGATPARFMHEVLMNSKHKGTIRNIHFYLPSGYNDADQAFNFIQFTQQLTEQVPNCCYLNVRHVNARNFKLESKTIKTLKLIDPTIQDETWEVNMPNLEELHMENHKPPAKSFAQALINSPLIKRFYAHKYWNKVTFPPLYLPNCQRFIFRRGDGTDSLKLYLPRVEELTLDACYSMQKCELLKQGHPSHAQWNISLDMVPGTSFKLSLKNAGLSKAAISSLRKSGRVLNPKALEQKLDYSHAFDANNMCIARDMAEAAKAGASKDEQLKHAMQRSWMRSDPVMAESHNFSEDEESDDSSSHQTDGSDDGPPALLPTLPSQTESEFARIPMLSARITDDDGGERVLDPKNPADKKILDEGVKRLPDHLKSLYGANIVASGPLKGARLAAPPEQTPKKGDTEREEGPNNSDDSDGGPPELLPTQPSQKEMKKSRLWGVAASREEDSSDGNESDQPETAAEQVEKILGASARRDSLASDLVKKARLTDDQKTVTLKPTPDTSQEAMEYLMKTHQANTKSANKKTGTQRKPGVSWASAGFLSKPGKKDSSNVGTPPTAAKTRKADQIKALQEEKDGIQKKLEKLEEELKEEKELEEIEGRFYNRCQSMGFMKKLNKRPEEKASSERKRSKTEAQKKTTKPNQKKLEDFFTPITKSRDRWTEDDATNDKIVKMFEESGCTVQEMKEVVLSEIMKREAKDAGLTDKEIKDYVLPELCNHKPGKNEKCQHLQVEIKANKKKIKGLKDEVKAAEKKLKTAKSKADHKTKEKSKRAAKEIKTKSSQIRDLTEKTKKMAEKTRSGGSKKKSKKERKPKGTSLTQYGVTSTKKELREMEWDWLFNLKNKLEKGCPITLKNLTEGFPLNKLFYTTEAAAEVKAQIKSNGNKKPAYTTNNLQLIQLLHASGFKFQHKAKQPAAPPVTSAKPLCPASVTSNDYATFMEKVIAKKLKEEAREARKQAKMKAALMESMKKK